MNCTSKAADTTKKDNNNELSYLLYPEQYEDLKLTLFTI